MGTPVRVATIAIQVEEQVQRGGITSTVFNIIIFNVPNGLVRMGRSHIHAVEVPTLVMVGEQQYTAPRQIASLEQEVLKIVGIAVTELHANLMALVVVLPLVTRDIPLPIMDVPLEKQTLALVPIIVEPHVVTQFSVTS